MENFHRFALKDSKSCTLILLLHCNGLFLLCFVVHTMREDFYDSCCSAWITGKWNSVIAFSAKCTALKGQDFDLRFKTNTTRKFIKGKVYMFA